MFMQGSVRASGKLKQNKVIINDPDRRNKCLFSALLWIIYITSHGIILWQDIKEKGLQ